MESLRKKIAKLAMLVLLTLSSVSVFAKEPEFCLDVCNSVGNCIHVAGWAYDRDNPSKAINVMVYIYKDAAFTQEVMKVNLGTTKNNREDVNEKFSIEGVHGFDAFLPMTNAGLYYVKVYAVDEEPFALYTMNKPYTAVEVTEDGVEAFSDVKLIGGGKDLTEELISKYKDEGWVVGCNSATSEYQDLNKGCGAASDYIYLLYKKASNNTPGVSFVTDFYISNGKDAPDSWTIAGRTYNLVPYEGSDHFVELRGDLNSHAGGEYIHLYYTKDDFPDNRAVGALWFSDNKYGAEGLNGDTSEGYDLNKGASGAFIYLHYGMLYTTKVAATKTALTLPYKNGFEGGYDGWSVVDGKPGGLLIGTGLKIGDAASGLINFTFAEYDKDQYLISPEFLNLKRMRIQFAMKGEKEKNFMFQVGTSNTTNDISAFQWSDVKTDVSSGWGKTIMEVTTGARYMAIRCVVGSCVLHIDDIVMEEMEGEPDPAIDPEPEPEPLSVPTDVDITDIADNSATVTWTGETPSYNIRYRMAPLFTEDFEGSSINWSTYNGTGNNDFVWHVTNFFNATGGIIHGHKGDNVAYGSSKNNSDEAVDIWLMSSEIALGGTLHYWLLDDGTNHENYEVYVATTNGNFELVAAPGHGDSKFTWVELTVDLSKYDGAQGRIAFRLKDKGKNFMVLDDISIVKEDWVTLSATDKNLELTSLLTNTTYEVQIQAVDGDNVSEWSDIATFTTTNQAEIDAIIAVRPETEAVTPDAWFDMNGRKLTSKPMVKGIYLNNGKKVMIK